MAGLNMVQFYMLEQEVAVTLEDFVLARIRGYEIPANATRTSDLPGCARRG